ncbi:MAG: AFG1 family ATPase [Gammaproteobacteria bacterium]|nr:AFG1 family ATPase [Gammaproteobacteria bacterium]
MSDPAPHAALSPRARYRRDLASGDFVADPAQLRAVEALETLHRELLDKRPRARWLSSRLQWPPVGGLYLWGGVGRGKSHLMDNFYQSLPFSRKKRTHFHRFMLEVHQRRRHFPDTLDPLLRVADEIAERVRVLCFDEFQVDDIGDAMILSRLLEGLFGHGVTLVTTSNVAPQDLYRDGLQRERFLPAIALLQRQCRVLELDGGTDYRLRRLHPAEVYLVPHNATNETRLQRCFERLAPHGFKVGVDLVVNHRPIPARRATDGIAWFDFKALCATARSSADYVELARIHHTLIVTGVPQFDDDHPDWARRFINLIDELYDRGVKLFVAAAVPAERLYRGRRRPFEFQRTVSRLIEMRSQEYLARAHLAVPGPAAVPAAS